MKCLALPGFAGLEKDLKKPSLLSSESAERERESKFILFHWNDNDLPLESP